MILPTLLFSTCLLQWASAATWTYGDGPKGPAKWDTVSANCAGNKQSPINIFEGDVMQDNTLNAFTFTNYNNANGMTMTLTNNGHSAKVSLAGSTKAQVSGGDLGSSFIVAQFHWHWGNKDSVGSEHLISSKAYPMELHIVHYNSKYADLGTAVGQADGLAVLGFMYQVTPNDNPNLVEIVKNLPNVGKPGAKANLAPFKLETLFPASINNYYRYSGSLTTPNCQETVTWTVFKDPIDISESQLMAFRSIFANDAMTQPLVNNYRPPLPLNGRAVTSSYDPNLHWSYHHGHVGVDHWKDYYSSCGLQSQSPINIPSTGSVKDASLGNFSFSNYNTVNNTIMEMTNNGHTAQVNIVSGDISINGGGLGETFKAAQFHFHWGSTSMFGSEHTVDSETFPMELHIVHYKASLGSIGAAAGQPGGLAVLGFFFEISNSDNPSFKPIVDNLLKVTNPKTKIAMNTITLDSLIPADRTKFYRYNGSLTTPGCYESVIWTVFHSKIQISAAQMQAFRDLKSSDKDPKGNYYNMVDNWRPVQSLNTRTVSRSFDLVDSTKISWSYLGSNGPQFWDQYFPGCRNTQFSRQSPINFESSAITYDADLPAFTFSDYNTTAGVNMSVINNGHVVQTNYKAGDLTIADGALPGTFKVAQFHFHWGSGNSQGSEHTVDSFAYPMELHIVHYNEIYPSVSVAATQPNGLAVLGFFFEVTPVKNPAFDTFINTFNFVVDPKSTSPVTTFALMNLLPKNRREYYRYDGSLTTPGCYESVTWTVFREVIPISQAQLDMFRDLKASDKKANGEYYYLVNNYRPTMPVNRRTVRANFIFSADSAHSISGSTLLTLLSATLLAVVRIFM